MTRSLRRASALAFRKPSTDPLDIAQDPLFKAMEDFTEIEVAVGTRIAGGRKANMPLDFYMHEFPTGAVELAITQIAIVNKTRLLEGKSSQADLPKDEERLLGVHWFIAAAQNAEARFQIERFRTVQAHGTMMIKGKPRPGIVVKNLEDYPTPTLDELKQEFRDTALALLNPGHQAKLLEALGLAAPPAEGQIRALH